MFLKDTTQDLREEMKISDIKRQSKGKFVILQALRTLRGSGPIPPLTYKFGTK